MPDPSQTTAQAVRVALTNFGGGKCRVYAKMFIKFFSTRIHRMQPKNNSRTATELAFAIVSSNEILCRIQDGIITKKGQTTSN